MKLTATDVAGILATFVLFLFMCWLATAAIPGAPGKGQPVGFSLSPVAPVPLPPFPFNCVTYPWQPYCSRTYTA